MQRISIKTVLILFCLSFLFPAQSEEPSKVSKQPTVEKSEKKASTKDNKAAQTEKQAKQEDKRKIAGMAHKCSEYWTDEFSFGYVTVGATCPPEENLCFAFFHVERNYCEGNTLIRHYCDPKQPSLISTEKIICKKSCEFSDLSGVCVK